MTRLIHTVLVPFLISLLLSISGFAQNPPVSRYSQVASERQSALKNVDITFTIQQTYKKGYFSAIRGSSGPLGVQGVFPPQDVQNHSRNRIVFQGEKIRFENNSPMWSTRTNALIRSTEVIVSRKETSRLIYYVDETPNGKINANPRLDDLEILGKLPITLTVRGNDPKVTRFHAGMIKLQSQNARIDGRVCEEYSLQMGKDFHRFWFDIDNRYCLRRITYESDGKVTERVNVKRTRDVAGFPFPDVWRYEQFSPNGQLLRQADYEIEAIVLKEQDDAIFEVQFPENCLVYDDSTGETFVADKSGSFSLHPEFNPRPRPGWMRRNWIVLPFALLGILLTLFFIRRYYRRREDQT